jgi:hypothetical protein
VIIAFMLGGTFGVMILSLCVVAGDADRQMERDLEERRCSEEVDPCSTAPTANPD